MLRVRRYRYFAVAAIVIIILLYRVSQNAEWDAAAWEQTANYATGGRYDRDRAALEKAFPEDSSRQENHDVAIEAPKQQLLQAPKGEAEDKIRLPTLKTETVGAKGAFGIPTPTEARADAETSAPQITTPPAKPPVDLAKIEHELISGSPDEEEATTTSSREHKTTTHWKPQTEYFPVPEEYLIPLPTGKPKTFPKVQHDFGQEDADKKQTREKRLATVKNEMSRAWDGYAQYAFGHDELMPVTNGSRDPFCGWAATLVDSLDTLWIMGMKSEFEDAYKGLADIDFTTTPRAEIPVFETTIRYLGGLIAAYDVTGGHKGDYPKLLEKAVELAEILMGIFDTPNRMPVLYYSWQPNYASLPHRAAAGSGMAEMATLSMEFTRLAQLTKKNKYYDAIARITNALEEWQSRDPGRGATGIPGIFPERVDATGCNFTIVNEPEPETSKASDYGERASEFEKSTFTAGDHPDSDSVQIVNGKARKVSKRDVGPEIKHYTKQSSAEEEDQDIIEGEADASTTSTAAPTSTKSTLHYPGLPTWTTLPEGWACREQNLTSGGYGSDSFSMGGAQDSAYEYFPKQHILLGGLEPKYRLMHERTIAAVKDHLLFRPMAPDNPDILFSAKANTRGANTKKKDWYYEYEVTHLTCFLGGMFGLGGRLFDTPEDIEIAAKLTDGCVWAYEVMPTGIMPEYAKIAPCDSQDHCTWNETAWAEFIDPNPEWRAENLENWKEQHATWEAEVKKIKAQVDATKDMVVQAFGAKQVDIGAVDSEEPVGYMPKPHKSDLENSESSSTKVNPLDNSEKSTFSTEENDLRKRAPTGMPKKPTDSTSSLSETMEFPPPPSQADTEAIAKKVQKLQQELDLNNNLSGHAKTNVAVAANAAAKDAAAKAGAADPSTRTDDEFSAAYPPEPIKPQSHQEYVEERVKLEGLPKGFTQMSDKRYILRPEAIESVWYMYRITGDTTWQDKGWRMFQSVIAATSVPSGHTAIDDVTANSTQYIEKLNNMESFWQAETLKYYYLLFAEPDVISLDEWVLNTEAHPFRRPL